MVRLDKYGMPIRKDSNTITRPRSRSRSPDRRGPASHRDDHKKRRDYEADSRRHSYDRYDRDDRRSDGRREERSTRHDVDRRSRGPTTHTDRGELVKPLPSVPAGMPAPALPTASTGAVRMIEVIANDRLGGKVRVKCSPEDTVGDLKKLIAAQKGTKPEKIVLKKWYTIYKDHVSLSDYEIHDGMCENGALATFALCSPARRSLEMH